MPSHMVLIGLVTGALPTLFEPSRPLRAKLVPCLLLLTLVAVMDWRDQQAWSYLAATLATHYILDLDIGHPQLRGIPNSLFLYVMGRVEAGVLHCCSLCHHRWVGVTWHHPLFILYNELFTYRDDNLHRSQYYTLGDSRLPPQAPGGRHPVGGGGWSGGGGGPLNETFKNAYE